eukprot:TRINITY_DN18713_c0_g1_i1.p1 TRINITY_DN18713_c0_g1~~TRINITY_DN18713_c0_g1_i1.p1  ORF type:complete len:978 (-),score=121.48 TRINITY_DN18713_c0_g1_i1:26-2887(-)
MAMLMAGAAGAGELFSYNRESYFFDMYRSMKIAYQAQEMHLKQFELYREDVRELIGLTVGKMENYLIVNTLQFGFTVTLLVEGRVEKARHGPTWLLFLIVLCTLGALMYYVLSIWLAIHASISSHSFGTRLLTQFVRLPVPSKKQIDKAAAMSEQYEREGVGTQLRIPFLQDNFLKLSAAMGNTSTESFDAAGNQQNRFEVGPSNPVALLEHVKLFRKLQANWHAYDAYARVCMSLGTYHLLHGMTYYCLGVLVGGNQMHCVAILCVLIFAACSWVIALTDLHLSPRILIFVSLFALFLPALATFCSLFHLTMWDVTFSGKHLRKVIFLMHAAGVVFHMFLASADEIDGVSLPRKWRSVLYLDVFGWLSSSDSDEGAAREDGVLGRLPEGLRIVIEQECRRAQMELESLFQRWESSQVKMLIGGEESQILQSLGSLRERFRSIVNSLPNSAVAQTNTLSSDSEAKENPVWLRLEYISYDRPIEFFHCCETEETRWEGEALPSGEEISDLPTLGYMLNALEDQKFVLTDQGPLSDLPQDDNSRSADNDNERFGGSEALPASRFVPETEREAGATFHPTRHRAAKVFWHRPGMLPWQTVWQGSMALFIAWMIAFMWSVLFMHEDTDGPDTPPETSEIKLDHVVTSDWPYPFLNPVGLAYHPRFSLESDVDTKGGFEALFAEKYAVHAVRLHHEVSPTPVEKMVVFSSPTATIVGDCLANAPSLQGRGLGGVSVHCPKQTSLTMADSGRTGARNACSVLMLGVDGRSVLRCPIGIAGTRRSPERISLLGGHWKVIAAAFSDDRLLWAANAKSIVLLGPVRGIAVGQLAPLFELSREAIDGIVQLQDIDGHTLLGVAADGTLRAWPLTIFGAPRRWQLSSAVGVPWSGGVCATAVSSDPISGASGSLFCAKFGSPSPTVSFWRALLPHDLLGGYSPQNDAFAGISAVVNSTGLELTR